jgi:hypothetical protein
VAVIITVNDLPEDIKSTEMVDMMLAGANAKASRVAPCLAATDPLPTADMLDEARLILVGAVKRWCEAGSGAVQSVQSGPFGQTVDTRQRTGYNLWPSEIEQLQDVCANGGKSASAFSITPSGSSSSHMPWCSLSLGALYCSCGADLTNYGFPLYEGGVLTTGEDY